jgi:hypothetical protein
MSAVFVTNHNAEPYQDRYDGEEYIFQPEKPVAIPEEAAQLFFGYKEPDRTAALQRAGRSFHFNHERKQYEDDPSGVKWLANFSFEEAVLQPASALAQALKLSNAPAAVLDTRSLL